MHHLNYPVNYNDYCLFFSLFFKSIIYFSSFYFFFHIYYINSTWIKQIQKRALLITLLKDNERKVQKQTSSSINVVLYIYPIPCNLHESFLCHSN